MSLAHTSIFWASYPKNNVIPPVTHDIYGYLTSGTSQTSFNIKINGTNVSITADSDKYWYYDIPAGTTLTSLKQAFYNLSFLKSVSFGTGIDTSLVTDMNRMFYGCTALTSINGLSNLNTSSCSDFGYMFSNCPASSIDVSRFNTQSATIMTRMFTGCLNVSSLDVSGFTTNNVTKMDGMFNGCQTLSSINVTGFNTSKVTTMATMFTSCSNLTSINVSSFNTGLVTTMASMFRNCSRLRTLDMRNMQVTSSMNYTNFVENSSNLTVNYTSGLVDSAVISSFSNVNWVAN